MALAVTLVEFALRLKVPLKSAVAGLDGRVDKLLVGELVLRAGGSRNLAVDGVDVVLKTTLHTFGTLLFSVDIVLKCLLGTLGTGILRVDILLKRRLGTTGTGLFGIDVLLERLLGSFGAVVSLLMAVALACFSGLGTGLFASTSAMRLLVSVLMFCWRVCSTALGTFALSGHGSTATLSDSVDVFL